MWTGILIYLYKRRAPRSLIVRDLHFFLSPPPPTSPPTWFVLFLAVRHLESSLFFVLTLTVFFLCSPARKPAFALEKKKAPPIFAAPLSPSLSLRWFTFVPFCSILHFLWVFYFWVKRNKKKNQTNKTKQNRTGISQLLVHAKMNCVKTKLVPLFSFSVMDWFLNISIYWYIKCDWKPPPCVLFPLFSAKISVSDIFNHNNIRT